MRIQCAPERYNVTNYSVTLRRSSKPEGNDWVVNSYDLKAPPNATEDTFLEVSYDSAFKPGVYRFTVIPVNPVCVETNKCLFQRAISESPPILIGNYYLTGQYVFTISANTTTTIIVIIITYN